VFPLFSFVRQEISIKDGVRHNVLSVHFIHHYATQAPAANPHFGVAVAGGVPLLVAALLAELLQALLAVARLLRLPQ